MELSKINAPTVMGTTTWPRSLWPLEMSLLSLLKRCLPTTIPHWTWDIFPRGHAVTGWISQQPPRLLLTSVRSLFLKEVSRSAHSWRRRDVKDEHSETSQPCFTSDFWSFEGTASIMEASPLIMELMFILQLEFAPLFSIRIISTKCTTCDMV